MKVVRGVVLFATVTLLSGNAPSETRPPLQIIASTAPRAPWEGLAIVVNRNNPNNNLTLAQLRALFLGEKRWWSNRRRVALSAMRRGTPERQTVSRVIYKMDDREFDKYFLYQTFKGEPSTSPATLKTPADVKRFVVSTPGAVGYLRASDLDDSVKVVRVDGLLPGDDGYPLRLRARPPK
jgi:ABC-type phosphate transport system substrate-binding protein